MNNKVKELVILEIETTNSVDSMFRPIQEINASINGINIIDIKIDLEKMIDVEVMSNKSFYNDILSIIKKYVSTCNKLKVK
jgi:hypothetical protein